jgi:hypothetical protein
MQTIFKTVIFILLWIGNLEASAIKSQIIERLHAFGNAKAYGFESDNALKHTIIGHYSYIYQLKKAKLFVAATNLLRDNDCHACAPKLSFIVVVDEQIVLENISALHAGTWGEAPSKEEIEPLDLGAKHYGVALYGAGDGQGWHEEFVRYYLPINGKFTKVLRLTTATDNGGAIEPNTTNWKSIVRYFQSETKLYDIIVQKEGIEDKKQINTISLYRFDGKAYQKVPQIISKAKSLKGYAYEMMRGDAMPNENAVIVKTNSKGSKIYCLADMSLCKTEAEVKEFAKSN